VFKRFGRHVKVTALKTVNFVNLYSLWEYTCIADERDKPVYHVNVMRSVLQRFLAFVEGEQIIFAE
jgi:hypothetical protein